jgi:hypothetical protein
VGFVCVVYWGSSYPILARSYREGLGFNNVRWSESDLVQAIKRLPASTLIYSNSPHAVYYHTGREGRRVPTRFSRVTRSANLQYPEELARMSRDLETGAVLVYFDLGFGATVADVGLLARDLELVPLQDYPDGTMYARVGGRR